MLPDAVLFDLYDTLVVSDWRRHADFVAGALGVSAEALAEAYRPGGRTSTGAGRPTPPAS
jgi:FMN phosphatase YigB (HAD superfamily)